MRAAFFLLCSSWLIAARAAAQAPSLDDLAEIPASELETRLVAIRNARDGEQVLLRLETDAGLAADARRDNGTPPHARGCLRGEEFRLSTQLALARAALDGAGYRLAAAEYRRMTSLLDATLREAERSGKWNKPYKSLGDWTRAWKKARAPRARELLRLTLKDQAIRASLSAFEGPRIYGKAPSGIALRRYDEYVFNLMCATDEENLGWLKAELTRGGWFDIGKYGKAADQAAWLLVQHADSEPDYQAYVAQLLQPKLATGDTSAVNYAYLVDSIAVRAGLPQEFATQMECVEGEWLAPKIEDPASLDARRAKMGLVPYLEQLARGKHLCRKKES